jgi:hypothetical protein
MGGRRIGSWGSRGWAVDVVHHGSNPKSVTTEARGNDDLPPFRFDRATSMRTRRGHRGTAKPLSRERQPAALPKSAATPCWRSSGTRPLCVCSCFRLLRFYSAKDIDHGGYTVPSSCILATLYFCIFSIPYVRRLLELRKIYGV